MICSCKMKGGRQYYQKVTEKSIRKYKTNKKNTIISRKYLKVLEVPDSTKNPKKYQKKYQKVQTRTRKKTTTFQEEKCTSK